MANFSLYLFLGIALVIVTVAVLYVSNRFVWSLGAVRHWPFCIVFLCLMVYTTVGTLTYFSTIGLVGHFWYVTAAYLSGFMLYLLLATVLVDLVHLFIRFNPRYLNFLTIGIALAVSIYGAINSHVIHLTTLDIPVKGLTKDVKAVHLTDIHIGHFRNNPEYLQEIIDKTNVQQPDIIFLTGDYIDAELALDDKYFEPLKQLQAPLYFVEGNHDEYVGVNEIMEKMRKVGVRVLEDEMTRFGELQIIGLNFMPTDREKADRNTFSATSTVKDMLASLKPNLAKPTILLHHGPNGIRYAYEHSVDVYLAGHTHGGQLSPMTWVTQMDFEYNKGLHKYGSTNVFVSQGIGTYGPQMRVGTKSEIVVLNLRAQNRK